MKILALEFSSDQRSVAVLDDRSDAASQREAVDSLSGGSVDRLGEPHVSGSAMRHGKSSTQAFELIAEALANAGWKRESIECLAVGLGPGSYTGIRIAIATAQGWQLTQEVKLIGVNSADALAWEAVRQGTTGEILVATDAQRQEFYLARYEIAGGGIERREALHLVSRAEVGRSIERGDTVIGPGITDIFPNGRDLYPHAETIAWMAAYQRDFCSGETLEPIYLRKTEFVKASKPRFVGR